jgi:hypothetical protein
MDLVGFHHSLCSDARGIGIVLTLNSAPQMDLPLATIIFRDPSGTSVASSSWMNLKQLRLRDGDWTRCRSLWNFRRGYPKEERQRVSGEQAPERGAHRA